jgi:hypothetical protein
MAESIDLICPTRQGGGRATNWLDGQLTHEGMRGLPVVSAARRDAAWDSTEVALFNLDVVAGLRLR